MVSNDSNKQNLSRRAKWYSPFEHVTLMCSCLKMRRSFPFCGCVHTNICQKGKSVQTKVFENTLFLKIEVA